MLSSSSRRRLCAVAASTCVVLTLAACGDDAATDAAAASSTPAERTSPSQSPSQSPSASPSPTEASSPSGSQEIGSGDEICGAFQGLADAIGSLEKPADITEAQFERYREALLALKSADLPAGVASDVVQGRDIYLGSFLALNLEQTRALDPEDPAAGLSDEEGTKANGFLSYLTETCPGVAPRG